MNYEKIVREVRSKMFTYSDEKQEQASRILQRAKAKYVRAGQLPDHKPKRDQYSVTPAEEQRMKAAILGNLYGIVKP